MTDITIQEKVQLSMNNHREIKFVCKCSLPTKASAGNAITYHKKRLWKSVSINNSYLRTNSSEKKRG